MKVVTSKLIRAMDRETIDAFGVPALLLMENAAIAVAERIAARWSPLKGKRVAIVCGKGNNGGDGLAIARLLYSKSQAAVNVWLSEDPEQGASPEFNTNLEIARRFGITVRPIEGWIGFEHELAASDLIVDAILGTGVEGDPRPAAARAIEAVNAAGKPVIAVDLPSGLNADTGAPGNPTVRATLTVTLAFSKLGLHLYPGIDYAGEISVADIGFPPAVTDKPELNTLVTAPSDASRWLPPRSGGRDTNKGKFGAVFLIAGSPGFAGAATLCTLGASRAGAGLVTLGVPKSLFDILMARTPATVMTRSFSDSPSGCLSAGAIKTLLAACEKADAVGIGPGLSGDAGTRELVTRFVRDCPSPLVIDADALNALSALPDRGASILGVRKAPTVLTPHPGEMGRLLGRDTNAVQEDRLGAVRDAVEQCQCVVLLKGSRTLIAAPDGRLAINETGNAGMASGGSGDVLTGIAAAFLAQVPDPWEAAAAAAYIHGLAGDMAAKEHGTAGLMATDLAEWLPRAMRQCGI